MKLFEPLFTDRRTGFYTIALALVVASLFVARLSSTVPLNTVAIIVLALAWLAEGNFKTKFRTFKKFWVWPPVILFLLYLVGVIYSENQQMAWSSVELKLSLVMAPLLIAGSSSFRKQHLSWSLFVFIWAAVVMMCVAYILALINGLQGDFSGGWIEMVTYEHLTRSISFQPIYLSFYLVFAFFGLIALHLNESFRDQLFYRNKYATYPVLAFLFVGIIMLSSRMEVLVLFATGAALILFFLPSKKQRRKYGLLLMALAVTAVGLILSSAENRQRFTEMIDISSDYTENQYGGRSIRLHKWKNALERWSQDPVLGVGTGDLQEELDKTYAKNNFDLALQYSFNPHNQYVETLLTLGIPGFVMLLVWLWGICLLGWRYKNWLLFAFGLIVSLSILTESMLERQWGIVFIAFFSVILMRYYCETDRESFEIKP